jgi:hypothetical protein
VSGSEREAHRKVDPLTDSEAVTLTGKKKPFRKQSFPSPVLFSSPELASERRVAAYSNLDLPHRLGGMAPIGLMTVPVAIRWVDRPA